MANQAIIVTDLSYGDAGKGSTVDYLVRQAASAVVIRHNGGAQAAHNVITPDGRHHTFAQFGSGSFVPGVRTHLSSRMLVNPLNMYPEAVHLIGRGVTDIWDRVSVDRDALIITPWHQAVNQLRELSRGHDRHGSCGQGIGETVADSIAHPELALRVRDLQLPPMILRQKLEAIRQFKLEQIRTEVPLGTVFWQHESHPLTDPLLSSWLLEVYGDWVDKVMIVDGEFLQDLNRQHELLVFEGAQGVLLDEHHGFHPYTTWSTTTHENALSLLTEIEFDGEVTKLGVMRAYMTRHGAGPFVSEDTALASPLTDEHNPTNRWQRVLRYGHLDALAHAYALAVCGETDGLVVTGLDRMMALDDWRICVGYQLADSVEKEEFFEQTVGGRITEIKPGQSGDLDRQAELTRMLYACSPVYLTVVENTTAASAAEYLWMVESMLGLPVAIASFGPTADDKQPQAKLMSVA